jgi:hypothetical protein
VDQHARALPGEAVFAEAWERGRELTLEEAVSLALERSAETLDAPLAVDVRGVHREVL